MNLHTLLAFWTISIFLAATPDADRAYVISAGIRDHAAVFPAVFGLFLGISLLRHPSLPKEGHERETDARCSILSSCPGASIVTGYISGAIMIMLGLGLGLASEDIMKLLHS
ncbi:hypothetical protein [Komagataeibacter xylinus]|uniref:Uncharacterized protein n=1 Tax=Komagataeibacter xylinus TaxID=28448 RepID=A0A857FPV5_KOMXY|nr:hypothetical protein [Komagataeibacter xylinus]QHC36371.1 hypothetical protein FMA36_13460 [Komagataeibacter xylinus]